MQKFRFYRGGRKTAKVSGNTLQCFSKVNFGQSDKTCSFGVCEMLTFSTRRHVHVCAERIHIWRLLVCAESVNLLINCLLFCLVVVEMVL